MRLWLKCVFIFIVLTCISLSATGNIKALIIVPYRYGANYHLIVDELERKGWEITTTGVYQEIPPCPAYAGPLGCQTITVDILITEISDVTEYDCVLITPSTTTNNDPCSDLMGSDETLTLIQNAVSNNLVVAAFCTGVRVLAAADVIDGRRVTGHSSYQSEYEAAGATFAGVRIPPVTDGNIVTCVRGDFYAPQNCEAIADCVETYNQEREGDGDE